MFICDHLAIVAHWARDQLRESDVAPAAKARLQQLLEDIDAVRPDIAPRDPDFAGNVVVMKSHRRDQRKRSAFQ